MCQDVLKSANLLHKWGLNDSQSNNPVIVHWIHQQSMKFQNCNHKSSWFSSLFLLDRQRNNDKDIINSTKYVMNHSWLSTVVSNLSCLICFFIWSSVTYVTISISTYLDVVNCEQGQIELKRSREYQFGMVASLCLILLTGDDASIINSAEDIRP